MSNLKVTDGGKSDKKHEILEQVPNSAQKPRGLTAFRFIRGLLFALQLIISAFVHLTILGPLAVLLLRPFNLILYRRTASFFFGNWLLLPAWNSEKVNGTKIVFTGENVPPKERVLLICNHRTELDWMYLWNFALRKGRTGFVKYALKSSFRNVPLLGWAFHILEFLTLERRWEKDRTTIKAKLSTFQDPADPLWLIIFPEGTDFTEAKSVKSRAFAADHHLPKLKHTLLPHCRGFFAALQSLRMSIDAVYDVTIAYKYGRPNLADAVFGTGPEEVHFHIERLPLDTLPHTEEEAKLWMYKCFEMKDQLLDEFFKEGSFPGPVGEEELSTLAGIVAHAYWAASSLIAMWLMFTKAIWLAPYMGLGALFLAAITYCNWLPGSAIEALEPHTKELAKHAAEQAEELSK